MLVRNKPMNKRNVYAEHFHMRGIIASLVRRVKRGRSCNYINISSGSSMTRSSTQGSQLVIKWMAHEQSTRHPPEPGAAVQPLNLTLNWSMARWLDLPTELVIQILYFCDVRTVLSFNLVRTCVHCLRLPTGATECVT